MKLKLYKLIDNKRKLNKTFEREEYKLDKDRGRCDFWYKGEKFQNFPIDIPVIREDGKYIAELVQ